MSESNFYKILEVDSSADAHAVKKAYFRLMRKYPPETHPEQFMKLREAYEVLSDPEARKEYDSMSAGGDAVAEQLRLATDALEEGKYPEAQAILARLINQNPELHFARDLLGITFMRAKQPDAALEIFEDLVVKHPTNSAYQLHRGQAHHLKKEFKDAEAAYQKAFELAPDDVRPLVNMSDCYYDQKRWDDALKVLDQAIHLDGTVDFKDFGLFVRKLEVELERHDSASIARTLAQLMPTIPEDEPSRRYVADKLASLAAPLFAMKRTDDANLLMKEAAKLDPKRGSGTMPNTFEVEIDELPEVSKQWLKDMKNTPSTDKVGSGGMGWAVVGLMLFGGGVLVGLVRLFAPEPLGGTDALFAMWVGLLVGGLLTALSLRTIVEYSKSPYGSYTIVHPLYLLQVKPFTLTAWPLANLHDVRLTHHHTNGVYSTTRVDLVFNGRTFGLNIYGKERSVEFANGILAKRKKMLELMYAGVLENSGDELRLVPAALIPEDGQLRVSQRAKARTKRAWVGAGVVAAVASLAAAVAYPLEAVKQDDQAWNAVRDSYYGPRVHALQGYLERYPSGRHVEDAKVAIDKVYTDAEAKVREHGGSELAPALLEMISVLHQKQLSKVAVKYESRTNFEKLDLEKLPPELKGKVIDPRDAFNEKANSAREREITESIEKALEQLLGNGVVQIAGGRSDYDYGYYDKKDDKAQPVDFVVHYEVGLTGALYESVHEKTVDAYGLDKRQQATDRKFLGIAFYWDFDVKFQGEEKPRYSFQFDSKPAKDIRWTTYSDRYGLGGYESPTLPYDKMAESAFQDFQHQIAIRFGIEKPDPRNEVAEDEYGDEGDAPAPVARPSPKVKPAKSVMAPKRRP